MKKNVLIYTSLILLIIGFIVTYHAVVPKGHIQKNKKAQVYTSEWNGTISSVINQATIVANIDSKQLKSTTNGIFMSDTLTLMIPIRQIRDTFDCSVREYNDDCILIEKGSNKIKLYIRARKYEINGEIREAITNVEELNGTTYVPVDVICQTFGYQYNFDMKLNQASIISDNLEARSIPYKYNYEDEGRVPPVSNQGSLGTCWAFASLTALESSLMPEEPYSFSVDHMSLSNSFNLGQESGGDYAMSMAYLLAWQGPVLEKDDPYGDGVTTEGLEAVKHVQEIQIIESKDFETIKKMIFKYGGVQSSFYASSLNSHTGNTKYYNAQTNSYCYIGNQKPNHDIVIIGWDDNYPMENFNADIEGDGAFICRNSWGSDFGNNGDFYISYYDTNIGVHNVVYTRVDDNENYDRIYQTDLCGYVGQLGYGEESAYFANAYTAKEDEKIMAVGFYATGIDTEYSVYICENFQDISSLSKRSEPVMTGKVKNSGFYTVDLDNSVTVKEGQKYAVIIRIKTPNSGRPVAVEYAYNEQTSSVILDDGEGYVSLKGIIWENAEEKNGCNVCLKVYTDKLTANQ